MATTTTATDSIVWGETYDLSVAAKDADGVDITLDGTWSAACRITKDRVGGEVILNPAMAIADGVATCAIDTGGAEFEAGNYFYDVRLTDSDGNDYWSAPVKLTLNNRNTPSS